MNKVWLVTGSASGLGRNIAEAVLESGDRLVATARDTKRLDDLVKKYGDRVRAVPLDVTDESAAQAQRQLAVRFLRRGAQRGRPERNSRAAPSLSQRLLTTGEVPNYRHQWPLTHFQHDDPITGWIGSLA